MLKFSCSSFLNVNIYLHFIDQMTKQLVKNIIDKLINHEPCSPYGSTVLISCYHRYKDNEDIFFSPRNQLGHRCCLVPQPCLRPDGLVTWWGDTFQWLGTPQVALPVHDQSRHTQLDNNYIVEWIWKIINHIDRSKHYSTIHFVFRGPAVHRPYTARLYFILISQFLQP